MIDIRCHICGKPIERIDRFTYHGCFGWERRGNAGGSDIRNRRQVEGLFAHSRCVDDEKSDVHPAQERLLV